MLWLISDLKTYQQKALSFLFLQLTKAPKSKQWRQKSVRRDFSTASETMLTHMDTSWLWMLPPRANLHLLLAFHGEICRNEMCNVMISYTNSQQSFWTCFDILDLSLLYKKTWIVWAEAYLVSFQSAGSELGSLGPAQRGWKGLRRTGSLHFNLHNGS